MAHSQLSTWDLLRSLGFEEEHTRMSDPPGALTFDFGNVRLFAVHCMGRSLQPSVVLSGVLATSRTVSEIACEIPVAFEGREYGVAWVTYCLDKCVRPQFEPTLDVPWLSEGRRYRHLLPWEQQRGAYAARDCCLVFRDWVRIAFRELREGLAEADADSLITFQFDGQVLKIEGAGHFIAMPASGSPWSHVYAVPAHSLHPLPKRLAHDPIEFSFFNLMLTIGNVRRSGAIQLDPVR